MRTLFVALALMMVPAGAPNAAEEQQIQRATFYADGAAASRGYFVGDRKVWLHETWWPNGVRRSSAFYRGDAFHGEYRTWRENGHPYELRHFDHGRESGLQRSWNDDGTVFLNYEARNGRRYGFINAVPCLPADENGRSKVVQP